MTPEANAATIHLYYYNCPGLSKIIAVCFFFYVYIGNISFFVGLFATQTNIFNPHLIHLESTWYYHNQSVWHIRFVLSTVCFFKRIYVANSFITIERKWLSRFALQLACVFIYAHHWSHQRHTHTVLTHPKWKSTIATNISTHSTELENSREITTTKKLKQQQ